MNEKAFHFLWCCTARHIPDSSCLFFSFLFSFSFLTVYIDEAVNLTSELHDPNAQINHLRKKEERKRPSKEHRCGASQIPSEG